MTTISDQCSCGLFVGERQAGICPTLSGRCLPQAPARANKRIRVPVGGDGVLFLTEDPDRDAVFLRNVESGSAVCVAATDVVDDLRALRNATSMAISELEERAAKERR